ncbi:uncharacterized protein H6S33_012395 [Morchella sextelata]|uniref:uncharacterized protein n=1 Tax=Morchella sextelata TaxID=1174677 RepID=UPI001D05B871|nr:uncharacterized protein H6S33_012395 [Morchella sextelata]KAH0609849.1 hypothetical protein H6S33_012395 [Morchella sextelata]
MNIDLSRWKSFRDKRESKSKTRRFSGELYGAAEDRSRKSLSLGSARAAAESSARDDANVPRIQRELSKLGIAVPDEKVLEVLRGRCASGDPDKALQVLIAIEDSKDGVVYDISSDVRMLGGAENNGGVTCFIDSLLFAMFGNMKAFEAMIYSPANDIDDEAKKMAAHIRLFVNLSRKGTSVTTEIIGKLQWAFSDAGWAEAVSGQQQDPSELFGFITDRLKLPLLTVKVDIAHGGKEMVDDDHKFINERLLNLSIPPEWGPDDVVPLEACLESYFHSRVDVKRQLERQATMDPLQPPRMPDHDNADEKGSEVLLIETADLGSQPSSPIATPQTPVTPSFQPAESSGPSTRPRKESLSLVRTVTVEDHVVVPGGRRKRATTMRKEVMLPAWCFFSILPFYTASLPEAENRSSNYAEHFAKNRPVLGLCLKRYSYHPKHGAQRDPRKIDVPLEVALPTFVSDDEMGEDGRVYGNFKLVLQSAVCHRGNSVHSGHYIALVRSDREGMWLRFDDMNTAERVKEIDHKTAFEEETPYMLFYQVQPLDSDERVVGPPPPAIHSMEATSEKRLSILSTSSENSISTIPMIPEPTVNEPPSYDNHKTAPEFGTSPPPEYTAGFLALPDRPEVTTPGDQNERLRPTSRSPQRPGSKDGASIESVKKRSKSENGVGDRWESMRKSLPGRGKSQDIFSFGSRKSSEWKREEQQKREDQPENERPSEDSGESEISENASVAKKKKDKKGKGKETEDKEKEKKGKNKEDKKDKIIDWRPGKEINRECTIS